MAPGNGYSNVIVREWRPADRPTGDLGFIQTADGQVWHVVDRLPYQGTGDRQGVIVDGRVRE
jgi:hypothetical protein